MDIAKNSKLIFLVVMFSLFLSLFNFISTPSAFACSCKDFSGCGCYGNAPLSQPKSPQGVGPLNLSNNLIFIIILAGISLGFITYKVMLSRKKVIWFRICRQWITWNCQRCGSAAFPNFRGGNFPEKCVRTNSKILHSPLFVTELMIARRSLRRA